MFKFGKFVHISFHMYVDLHMRGSTYVLILGYIYV